MFDFSTKAHRKEAWLFLETVWKGLEYLCQQVQREERERAKTGKNFAYTDFGNQPGDAMVCNYFLWYASALYNFIAVFQKAFSVAEDLNKYASAKSMPGSLTGAARSQSAPHRFVSFET
jgi:hypothetical protein